MLNDGLNQCEWVSLDRCGHKPQWQVTRVHTENDGLGDDIYWHICDDHLLATLKIIVSEIGCGIDSVQPIFSNWHPRPWVDVPAGVWTSK